jgi:hypothetical protein
MKVYSPSIIEGLIVSGSATISGGLIVEGTISASGLTGDIENAQTASYVEFDNVVGLTDYSASVRTSVEIISASISDDIVDLQDQVDNITTDFNNFTSSVETALTLDGENVTTNGDLTITGDLTVQGTQTIINTEVLSVESNIIELNTAGAVNGGILVGDVTAPSELSGSLLWHGDADRWVAGISGSEEKIILEGEFTSYTSSTDTRITDLENFSSSLDDTFATDDELAGVEMQLLDDINTRLLTSSFNSYTSSNDFRMDAVELETGDLRTTLNSYTSSTDNRIGDLENFSSSLDATFATDAELESATSSIITTFNNYTSSADIRLGSLETESGSIRTAFNSYTSSTDNRIDELENFSSSLDATFATDAELESATSSIITTFNSYTSSADIRLGSLETESGSIRTDFSNYTSSTDNRLSSIETESGSIRSDFNSYTSSADGRIGDLENFSSSLDDTFATDSELTAVQNLLQADIDTRVLTASFTAYTSSTDLRLGTLELESGSIRTTLNNYTSSTDLRLGSLETESGSIRTTVNNYTSSTDARLSSIEQESGSIRTTFNNFTGSNGVVSSSAQVDHNATTNYVANQHIDHSTVNISAGSGMTGGGDITTTRTLTLDTGSTHFTGGVKTTLDSNTVISSSAQVISSLPAGTVSASSQVQHDSTTGYAANEHIDHSTVDITAGSGLSGGGNITATRTLTLDTGSTHFTSGVKTKLDADQVVSGSDTQVKTFLSLNNVDNTADADKPLSTAQKAYVDEVAQGLKARTAALVLVDTDLNATYDNGVNGSGSFLESNTNGAFPTTDGIDSTVLNVVGIRILVIGQTNKEENGLYVVQTAGNGSTPWKIRRCVECDSDEEIPGSFIFVKSGTVYANTGWILLVDNPTTFTIGTDDINPTQFSGAGSFLAGDGLGLDGNTFSLDTGSSHFTDGVKARLEFKGVISGSGQVDHNATTNYVANQHIDHSTVNISAGAGMTGGGDITTTRTLTLDTGSTHFTGGVKTTLNTNTVVSSSAQIISSLPVGTVSGSAQVDHNATTNYVANQHIDHSTVNISAGNGLTGGGTIAATRTLTLDTGSTHFTAGVKTKMNTDGVVSSSGQIDHNTTTNYVANQHIDHTTVNITAGLGLTGGGTIAATRTLTLDTGSAHFTTAIKGRLSAEGVVSGSGQIDINSTTGTLNVNKGGTGQTSYANGELLIGNTTGNTLVKATLTAGTGISITNGAGSISIAATNNGTVTSIATGNGITGGTITSTGTLGLDGQALALHNLSTNGVIARTGAGTVAGRTITGTTNQVTVANGDGVSGNPTLSLPQNIHTAATPTFGAITINGTIGARASTSTTAATQFPVFNADPASTTRTIVTRTPAEVLSDIGAYAATNPAGYTTNTGTVTSIATNNGITGGTITTTGTVGLTGQALALHNLATNGIIARTGTGTVAGRTITASTGVTVSNGDGVSGNPTISIGQAVATSSNVQFNSLGVGTAASATAGEIRATNEITAFFSDARLKNFHGRIQNPLFKVLSLSGYYFTENEVAKSLGYDNDKMQVGLSAQEVQAVLPEVVTEAPISDEYLTVRYEKLIPLLVEAIKEQQQQIEELKAKLDNK